MAERFDISTLRWLKGEIDETLEQARIALVTFIEEGQDENQIGFCVSFLHQVRGSLQLVELNGATRLASEMEQAARALEQKLIADAESAVEVLMRAFLQMPDYLEALHDGLPDHPVILLPIINELRQARGESPLTEIALFNPDLEAAPPVATAGAVELHAVAAKARAFYQSHLVNLLQDKAVDASLKAVSSVFEKLLAITGPVEFRRWAWAMAGLVEGLRDGGIERSKESKQLLARAEQLLKLLAAGGALPLELLAQLTRFALFMVAGARSSGPRIQELKTGFGLDALRPSESVIAEARARLGGFNTALKRTVAADIMEELTRIKETLDIVSRRPDHAADELGKLVTGLSAIASTTEILQQHALADALKAQIETLRTLLSDAAAITEQDLMGIAEVVLSVESALADWGTSGLADDTSGGAEENPADAEHRRVVRLVMREAKSDLIGIKEGINRYLAAPDDKNPLREIREPIRRLIGSMEVVGYERVAQILRASDFFLTERMLEADSVPPDEQLDLLADALTSIEYYFEAFVESRVHPASALEVAERSVATLGYPVDNLPEPVVAAPAPAPMAQAPSPAEVEVQAKPEQAAAVAPPPPAPAPAVPPEEDEEIIEIFTEEAREQFASMDDLFPRWRSAPGDAATLKELRRCFHTLKGSGRLVGAKDLGEFAWAFENMLNRVIDGTVPAGERLFDLMDRARPLFDELLTDFRAHTVPDPYIISIQELAHVLSRNEVAAGFVIPERGAVTPATGEPLLAESTPVAEIAAEEPAVVEETPVAAEEEAATAEERAPVVEAATIEEPPAAELPLEAEEIAVSVAAGKAAGEAEAPLPEPIAEAHAAVSAAEPAAPIEPIPASAAMDPVLLEIYSNECFGHLATITGFLERCRSQGGRCRVEHELVRALHTLRGASRTADVPPVARLSGLLEDYVKLLHTEALPLPDAATELLGEMVDSVGLAIEHLSDPARVAPSLDGLAERAEALLHQPLQPAEPVLQPEIAAAAPVAEAPQTESELERLLALELEAMAELDEELEAVSAPTSELAGPEVLESLPVEILARAEMAEPAGSAVEGIEEEPAVAEPELEVEELPAEALEGFWEAEQRDAEAGAVADEAAELGLFSGLELDLAAPLPFEAPEASTAGFPLESEIPVELPGTEPVGTAPQTDELELALPGHEAALPEGVIELADLEAEFAGTDQRSDLEAGPAGADELAGLEAEFAGADELAGLEAEFAGADELADLEAGSAGADELADLEAGFVGTNKLTSLEAELAGADELAELELLAAGAALEETADLVPAATPIESLAEPDFIHTLLAEEHEPAGEFTADNLEDEELAALEALLAEEPFGELPTVSAITLEVPAAAEEPVGEAPLIEVPAGFEVVSEIPVAGETAELSAEVGAALEEAVAEPAVTAAATPEPVAPVPAAPVISARAEAEEVCDPELVELFLEEAVEILDATEVKLQGWRRNLADRSVTEALQRLLHTLKGGARVAGARAIGDLSHEVESLLTRVVEGLTPATPELVSLLERTADRLVRMVEALRAGTSAPDIDDLADELRAFASGRPAAEPQPAAVEVLSVAPAAAVSAPQPAPAPALEQYDTDLLEIFVEEGAEILDSVEIQLQAWKQQPADRGAVEILQRLLHTLKGGARMSGVTPMGDLSHEVETLLTRVVDGHLAVSQGMIGLLQVTADRLVEMLDQLKRGAALSRVDDLVENLRAVCAGRAAAMPEVSPELPEVVAEPVPEAVEPVAEPQAAVAEETAAPAAEPSAPMPLAPAMAEAPIEPQGEQERRQGSRIRQEMVRVRADLFDELVNLAGEASIYRSRIGQQIGQFRGNFGELEETVERLREQMRSLDIESEAQIQSRYEEAASGEQEFDPLEFDRFTRMQQLSRSISESLNDLMSLRTMMQNMVREAETLLLQQSRINTELQEGLMQARMVPLVDHAPRLRRVVRQACADLGRQAELHFRGAEVELDRTVLERMLAPLEHLLRNAVAHGVEPPEARVAQGKGAVGRVVIALGREGGEIVMRVSDDGRGIDLGSVRRKAIERGLLSAHTELSDREVMQFILEAGFSTASVLTQVAGRGVGMDVVNSEVKQLGGSLEIDSRPGEGTAFIIRLPLTLAVSRALLVQSGSEIFAIPLLSIQGIVRVSQEELAALRSQPQPTFHWIDQDYHLLPLAQLVGGTPVPPPEGAKRPLVLAQTGDHRVALEVDGIIGSREVVVKSLGAQLAQLHGLSGATILGDGTVAMILDMPNLIRQGLARPYLFQAAAEGEKAPQVPTVMVVDDSITVRRVTQRLLERNQLQSLTAKDGVEALAVLEDHMPDVILLDIEMPRMDGYELATHIRNNERLRHIPMIMITSRTGDKHRQRAIDIGVDRYLGKPFQEADLLDNIRALLGSRHENRRAAAG